MSIWDLVIYLVIGIFFLIAVIKAYMKRNRPCEKCGGKMEFKKLEDPMGFNITPKFTISIYIGPRKYKETWRCKKCGLEKVIRYWDTK